MWDSVKQHGGDFLNKSVDSAQTGLDVVGMIDPTGIADAANAGFSGVRAAATNDPNKRAEYIKNAGLSLTAAAPSQLGWGAGLMKIHKGAKGSMKTKKQYQKN